MSPQLIDALRDLLLVLLGTASAGLGSLIARRITRDDDHTKRLRDAYSEWSAAIMEVIVRRETADAMIAARKANELVGPSTPPDTEAFTRFLYEEDSHATVRLNAAVARLLFLESREDCQTGIQNVTHAVTANQWVDELGELPAGEVPYRWARFALRRFAEQLRSKHPRLRVP